MFRMVARDSAAAWAMPRKSPFTRVTPALCMATSVPVPMAMPTSAAASAGASLMPSPAIATLRPLAISALTCAALSSGSTSAMASSIPSLRATASAVLRESPVSITTRMPVRFSAAMASAVVSLIGSATESMPVTASPMANSTTVVPSARWRSASPCQRSTATPSFVRKTWLPTNARFPSTVARTPRPLTASNPEAGAGTNPRAFAPSTIDAAIGCSLSASTPAINRSASFASVPSLTAIPAKAGLPKVSVPVLSTTSVSISRMRSIASALRNRMPMVAARPMATVMEIGVARPTAHGQAMMSTATALASA